MVEEDTTVTTEDDTTTEVTLEEVLPAGTPGLDHLKERQIDTVGKLLTSFQEARKKISAMVTMPDAETSAEDRTKFYRRLGAPETVEGYTLPEGVPASASLAAATALDLGLTPNQFQTMVNTLHQSKALAGAGLAEVDEMLEKAKEGFKAKLEKLYGSDAAGKRAQAERARKALLESHSDLDEFLKGTGLDEHPFLTELMVVVGEKVGEDKIAKTYASTTVDTGPKQTEVQKARDLCEDTAQIPGFMDGSCEGYREKFVEFNKACEVIREAGYDGYWAVPKS